MIDIRPVRGHAEMRAIEDMQKEIWAVEDREIVPAVHLIPACEVGAILLGAFDDGQLVGFVYGFPGFEGAHRIIHSDMLAVRVAYRDRGLGTKLKLAQREHALQRGIDLITWTFDPMQTRNAWVNFHHLGVIADRYLRDFYGTTTSQLHSGGTDRLWVKWYLRDSPRFREPSLRIEWSEDRLRLRAELEEGFADGYVVTGFIRYPRPAYLLSREDE